MKDAAMDIGEESLSPPPPSSACTQPMRDSDVKTSAEAGLMTRAAATATAVAIESTATAATASQGKAVATTTSSTAAATAADREDESAPLIEAGNVEVEEDAAGADQATSTSPQASATAAASTESSKQNILLFSRGDRPHAKTLCAMTISEPHTTEVEAMAVDMVEHHRRASEDSDDAPINLAFHPTPANLMATSSSATAHGLSAKMRLKKQRLEAVAQAAAEMQLNQIQSNTTPITADPSSINDHSALHRLAEAAERKQVR